MLIHDTNDAAGAETSPPLHTTAATATISLQMIIPLMEYEYFYDKWGANVINIFIFHCLYDSYLQLTLMTS